jgi:hypothetical protein
MREVSAIAFVLCLSAPAWAQDEGDEAGAEEGAEELEQPDVEGQGQKPAIPAPPKAGETGEPQVSETHNVQSGDTLWDLCTKYLNSPWYWPKIWSYNPQITNPHWIYPGNELRFYPSDENLPTNVEVSKAMTLEESSLPDDVVSSAGNIRTGRIAQNSAQQAHIAFLEAKDHQKAGSIEASFFEGYLLSPYNTVYVKFGSAAKAGDGYAVYRTVKEIEHPVTGDSYGYVVELVGTARVTGANSEGYTSVVLTRAFSDIQRGDWVGPWPESASRRVSPTANQANTKGYILDQMETTATLVGEHHIVFVDRGRAQGVQLGNIFTVLHRGDAYLNETENMPYEDVGKLMVIDVRENASTAIVIRSLTELSVGDKVELRAGES